MGNLSDQIIQALARRPEVSDWSLQRADLRSTQRYLIGTATESSRQVERRVYPLTIFRDHSSPAGEPSRGMASATVLADGSNLASVLDEALLMAGLVHNRPYRLAQPAPYPEVAIADPAILAGPDAAAEELLEQLRAAVAREPEIRLSSAELFLEQQGLALHTSSGVQAEASGTRVLFDLVLLAGQGSAEMEAHIAVERRRLADLDIAALVARQAGYARDALRASVPRTGRGAVVLRDEALVQLLGNDGGNGVLSFHASAYARYHELSQLQEGQPITGEQPITGDRLTFGGSRLLPFGLDSAPFDGDGLPAQELVVIRDSCLERRWASQRYADYLGIPATGSFGNVVLAAGQLSLEQLLDQARLQVVSFSWMDPDPVTGDFVAEIRLGYERDGQSWRPVRGGSLSGNLFSALADVRLSAEQGFFGHYVGPVAARFGDLTIAGE